MKCTVNYILVKNKSVYNKTKNVIVCFCKSVIKFEQTFLWAQKFVAWAHINGINLKIDTALVLVIFDMTKWKWDQ